MRGRVVSAYHRVATSADYSAVKGDNGADGNLAGLLGCGGLGKRLAHELFIAWLHVAVPVAETNANVTESLQSVSRNR